MITRIIVLTLSILGILSASTKDDHTFVKVGLSSMTYQETTSLDLSSTAVGKSIDIKSDVTITYPSYSTGSLVNINSNFDLYMNATSSLVTQSADEDWKVEGELAKKNKYDVMHTAIEYLLHYKLTEEFRLITGFTYDNTIFKRYKSDVVKTTFVINNVNVNINTDSGVVEENRATLGLNYGVAYHKDMNAYGFNVYTYMNSILWQRLKHSEHPEKKFDSTDGYNAVLYGDFSYYVNKNISLGIYGKYDYLYRKGQTIGNSTWPENTMTIATYGAIIKWDF